MQCWLNDICFGGISPCVLQLISHYWNTDHIPNHIFQYVKTILLKLKFIGFPVEFLVKKQASIEHILTSF